MNWLRVPITIKGKEYTIEQQGPNDPVQITSIREEHDWVCVDVWRTLEGRDRLIVSGKGWVGENPS